MITEVKLTNMTEPYLEILKLYQNETDSDIINQALDAMYWKLWETDPDKMKKCADEYHNRP
jgi:hypothetical protein